MEILLRKILLIFSISIIRYLLFAGIAYLIFYVWKRKEFFRIKIQQKFPEGKRIQDEVMYSVFSMLIFSITGAFVFWLSKNGYTLSYKHFNEHGLGYFIFSVVAFIIAHDTYFYWTHRFMHWDKVYKYVHRVHHLSTNPTPWAAFSFHPLEAIIEVGILPIMVMILPLHVYAILAWVLYMTLLNVMGHLGFEIFPSGFTKGVITKWHNSSVHHNMHHKYVRCNYSLYFNIWDRLLHTNHEKYDEEFEAVKAR